MLPEIRLKSDRACLRFTPKSSSLRVIGDDKASMKA